MIDVEIIKRDVRYARPSRSPSFPYPGGKHSHRKFIIRWIPLSGSVFVEPFAGRANVFFVVRRCGQFDRWILNDIRTDVFLRAIQKGVHIDDSMWPVEKRLTVDWLKGMDARIATVMEPYVTWGNSFYDVSKNVWPVTSDTIERVGRILDEAKRLLSGVRILKRDAHDLIEEYADDSNAVMYLDPPYVDGNVSTYSRGQVNWGRLYSILRSAKCGWLMSEYENRVHNKALGEPVMRFEVHKGKDKVWEVLYSNRPAKCNVFLSWGYSVPMLPSTRMQFRDGQILTENDVIDKLPSHWSIGNKRMEMGLVKGEPFVWWNGKVIEILRGYESVMPVLFRS